METSEGFNDFMYELGVNFVTRNIANNLYPLQQIRQDPADEMISLGNNNNKQTNKPMSLHILIPLTTETLTSFRTTKIEFKLGEEFEECTADGRDCKTLASLDAEKRQLVKVRTLFLL